jgi:hypothetical protein
VIKILIISHPDEIPSFPSVGIVDNSALHAPDGNLNVAGLRVMHGAQAVKSAAQAGYSAVVLCRTPWELVDTVADRGRRLGPIDRLDIVAHGAPGLQKIGNDVLFQANEKDLLFGGDVVLRLLPALAANARVRLLGCRTATERPGRTLLVKLAQQFGGEVIVYGTIDRVSPEHFETGDFSQVQELLFSSDAAIDRDAPTADERRTNLLSLLRQAPAAAA